MCVQKSIPAGQAGEDAINDVQEKLIRMNDEQGRSFTTIANWIDKNL
jgi:hypothetical protein